MKKNQRIRRCTARSDAIQRSNPKRDFNITPNTNHDGTRNNRIEQRHRKSQRPIFDRFVNTTTNVTDPPPPLLANNPDLIRGSDRINELVTLVFQDSKWVSYKSKMQRKRFLFFFFFLFQKIKNNSVWYLLCLWEHIFDEICISIRQDWFLIMDYLSKLLRRSNFF